MEKNFLFLCFCVTALDENAFFCYVKRKGGEQMDNYTASLLHYAVNEAFLQHWSRKDKYYVMRARRSCGLFCVVSGSARYRNENADVTAMPGDALLIRKNSCYTAYFEMPETVDYLINFDCDGDIFSGCTADFVVFRPKRSDEFLSNVAHLVECMNRGGNARHCLAKAHFYTLLDALFLPTDDGKELSEVVRAAENDTAFALGEKELARSVGMSVSTFRRNFFSATGMNPSEYRNALRTAKAKSLLSDGSESIERIAELLGFCDGAYFSRFFKRQTGLSPSAYRFRAHAP